MLAAGAEAHTTTAVMHANNLTQCFIGVLHGRKRPRRLESLRAARFEALRAGCLATHVEFLRCGPRSAVLESEHEECHAQLPDSCLSEWRAAPTSRALVRGQSVAVEHRSGDSLGGVSRLRTEPDRQ